MSLHDPIIDPALDALSRSVDLGSGVGGGLLAMTIGDVRTALVAGFSACEVEYMLDLPRGRLTGLPHCRV